MENKYLDGLVNVVSLKDGNSVIVLIGKDNKSYLIPKIGETLYYDNGLDDKVIAKLKEIVSSFMGKQKDSTKTPPQFSKEVIRFASVSNGKVSNQLEQVLKDAGYTIAISGANGSGFQLTPDLSDPELKKIWDENEQEIAEHHYKWDSTPDKEMFFASLKYDKNSRAGLMTGAPGCGKSTDAKVGAHQILGLPYISVQITAGTDFDSLFGAVIPTSAGTFEYKEGSLSKYMTSPFCVILDEVTYSKEELLNIYNSLCDKTKMLYLLNEKEAYEIDPNFRIIFTMNPGTGNILMPALIDRVVILNYDTVTPKKRAEQMKSACADLGHTFSDKFYNLLIEFSDKVKNACQNYGEPAELSRRRDEKFFPLILNKELTRDEFAGALAICYTNSMNVTLDNAEVLTNFKTDTEYQTKVNALYGEYDYRKVETTDSNFDFEAFFSDESASIESDDILQSGSFDKQLDDLLNS